MEEKVKLIRVDPQTHREFRALCALLDVHLKDAATEALRQWMERKKAVAEALDILTQELATEK